MFTRAEIKAQAREQLKGNVWMIFLCMLVYFVISLALSFIMEINGFFMLVGFVATFIVVPPIYLGIHMLFLDVTYGDAPSVSTLFRGFQQLGPSIILNLLVGIYTFLWTLLFIIPGLIKQYSYYMAFYILAENPQMTPNEAITESREIMNGHKWDLFVLGLSFFPWILLFVFTFGIAGIYVIPYMQLTITNFYHNVKRQSAPEEVVYDAPYVETVEDVVE